MKNLFARLANPARSPQNTAFRKAGQTCWIAGFGVGESYALRGPMRVCPVLRNAQLASGLLLLVAATLFARPATAAPGNPDNTFQQQGVIDGPICAVIVDSMTNIWIGGRFLNVYGHPCPYLAVLNPDGSFNATASNNGLGGILGVVHSLAVDDVNNIYVGGARGAARLNWMPNAGWANDTAFLANASPVVWRGDSIAVERGTGQAAQGIFVAGTVRYTNGNGYPVYNVAALHSDGTVDTSFTIPAGHESDEIFQVRFIPACGGCGINTYSTPLLLFAGNQIVMLMQNNLADYLFTPGYPCSCAAIRTEGQMYFCGSPYGEIIAGGFFDAGYYGTSDQFGGFNLDRFAGTVSGWFHDIKSSHFPHDNGSSIASIETFQGGDMVIAGLFTTVHDANKANFAHLFADGSVDQNFTDASDIPVFAMALQPDGKFILAGETTFSPFGGKIQRRMGLNPFQPVSFSQQPASQTVFQGESTCFQPIIVGTPPPTSLLWIKDNIALTNQTNIFICINGATPGDAGDYRLRAEKFCGNPSHVDSETAHLTVLAPPPPPPNDMFSNAITLTGASVNGNSYIRSSTVESGEPNHAGNANGRSVWWNWTAPFNGRTTVDCSSSDFTAAVGVYKGSTVNSLTLVASSFGTNFTFTATSNTTYHIAVGGIPPVGSLGNVVLRLNAITLIPISYALSTGFNFQVTGPGTGAVIIDATLGLNPPNWQPIATGSLVNGSFNYQETQPLTNASRFYRARLP